MTIFQRQLAAAACLAVALGGCAHVAAVGESRRTDAGVAYARFLATFVRSDGVDYAAARGRAGDLDTFLAALAGPLPRFADADDKKGFFIDAYNACVIGVVLQHPELRSIQDLTDPFGAPRCRVGGRLRSLDELERTELRSVGDPRVHVVLVCASRGCPALEPAPFRAPGLGARLDAAARRFFASGRRGAAPDHARADAATRTLWLSHLFAPDWLGPDFGPDERAVLAWIRRFAPAEISAAIDAGYRVQYLAYDWALNASSDAAVGFVAPQEAQALIGLSAVVLDARAHGFAAAHLPPAAPIDDRALVDAEGRHKDPRELARVFTALGVDDTRPLIVYGAGVRGDGEEGHVAWLLVLLGHPCVRILDGGVDGWVAAGRPIATGPAARTPTGRLSIRLQAEVTIAVEEVARAAGALILDVRSDEEWARGHLPSARHLEWKRFFLDGLEGLDGGRLRPPADIAALLEAAGGAPGQPIVTYCTSGVRSAFAWAALRAVGRSARNFEGSYAEWTRDPKRPLW